MDKKYYISQVEKVKLVGGYKAYLNIQEMNDFDEYCRINEKYQKYCEVSRKLNVKEIILNSETDFNRRDKLESEMLELMIEGDKLYFELFDVSKNWYLNLLDKEISDGESD